MPNFTIYKSVFLWVSVSFPWVCRGDHSWEWDIRWCCRRTRVKKQNHQGTYFAALFSPSWSLDVMMFFESGLVVNLDNTMPFHAASLKGSLFLNLKWQPLNPDPAEILPEVSSREKSDCFLLGVSSQSQRAFSALCLHLSRCSAEESCAAGLQRGSGCGHQSFLPSQPPCVPFLHSPNQFHPSLSPACPERAYMLALPSQ